MAQARVLFMSGRASGGATWESWRLVSANNRELARSALRFDDHASCLVGVERLRDGIDSLESRWTVDPTTGLWHWSAQLDGTLVLRSSRAYQRERECRYSLRQALDVLPTAAVSDEVINLSTRNGRRRSTTPPGSALVVG